MKKTKLLLLFIILIGALSCEHDPLYTDIEGEDPNNPTDPNDPVDPEDPEACDPNIVYFENEVLPIIISSCSTIGCHGNGSAQDGIELSNYAGIMDIVEPNDPSDSELIEVITETDPDKIMPPPPNAPLSDEQINTIIAWINQGAQNNECTSTACDTSNVTFSQTVWPVIQNKCTGCHSGGSPSGGIRLENYNDVSVVAANGKLFGSINHDAGFVPMPFNSSKLPQCEIDQIEIWINDGYPNN